MGWLKIYFFLKFYISKFKSKNLNPKKSNSKFQKSKVNWACPYGSGFLLYLLFRFTLQKDTKESITPSKQLKEIFYILALIKAQYCKAIIYKNRIKNIFMYQMSKEEEIINKVAQDKIDFNLGVQLLLENPDYDFERLFIT